MNSVTRIKRVESVAMSVLFITFLTKVFCYHEVICPRCRTTYKAVNGDTCQSIANKHGITKDHLSEWTKKINASFDCDKVKPGDSICLNYEDSMEKRSVKKAPAKKHTTTKKPVHPKKHTTAKKPAHAKGKREVKKPTDRKKKPAHFKKHTTEPVPPFKGHARD